MELYYQALIDKPVVTADGERIGRVADLAAEARGERLYVTALLVGPGSLLRRISFKRVAQLDPAAARQIPWELVARIGRDIRLRVDAAALARLDAEAATAVRTADSMPEKTP
ncbi:MAG TPA: PRC-barrel domain-containing protein [Chloroflexota bacterium]|nr:PRC-barrel domain-containing protein [Chloroflexota bacterium]